MGLGIMKLKRSVLGKHSMTPLLCLNIGLPRTVDLHKESRDALSDDRRYEGRDI